MILKMAVACLRIFRCSRQAAVFSALADQDELRAALRTRLCGQREAASAVRATECLGDVLNSSDERGGSLLLQ